MAGRPHPRANAKGDTGDHLGGTHRDEGPPQGFERLGPEPFEGPAIDRNQNVIGSSP